MRRLGIFYTVLITAAVLGTVTAIVVLYRSGSAAVPGWQSLFQPGPLSAKHAFLAEKCETCHTPTRGVEASACIGCHSTSAADLAKQPTSFHANAKDCRGCHVEHGGGDRPTKMDHASLLRIGAHLAEGAPHAGLSRQMIEDISAFLGTPVSSRAEKSRLDCASCHSNQDPHKQLFGRECASCHDTVSWRIAAFLHPSPTSTDCAQCHQAPPSHYMMHFEMVSKRVAGQEHAQVSQCQLCHKTNVFNDIKGVGWFKMH